MSQLLPEDFSNKTFLTPKDVESILGCSIRHVRRMIADGRLPTPHRFQSRLLRWPREVIERWLHDQLENATKRHRH